MVKAMIRNILAAALTLVPIGACAGSLDYEFETALGVAGLTTKTATFDPGIVRLYVEDAFANPTFKALYDAPWRAPFFCDNYRKTFSETDNMPQDTIGQMARMMGVNLRRGLLGSPIKATVDAAKQPGYLKALLLKMKADNLIIGDVPEVGSVPAGAQSAAALILKVAADRIEYRRAAFSRVGNMDGAFQRLWRGIPEDTSPILQQDLEEFYRQVDLKFLYVAGIDLQEAVNEASVQAGAVPITAKYRVEFKTVWGKVVLSGGTDDNYATEPTFLILDTGGEDTYNNLPSNRTVTNWASTVIDTAGDDKYISDPNLGLKGVAEFQGRKGGVGKGPGSACLGYSYLIDSRGDDVYASHLAGIGSAVFGVASVIDRGGNDRYDGYGDCEGYGFFGLGLLEDSYGRDLYQCFNQGQGFGGTQGLGALIDREGNDNYVANDTEIDFASPQSDKHNVSFAQGAASGRRADYIDGHCLSGGVGLLFDEQGDDKYSCGVFGQGVGYWQGTGFLWDAAGVDQYVGQWYVQGAAAHFAIGYLQDQAGNDIYKAGMNMALGAGHDFSIGALIDDAGDDSYTGPNLSLGAGNANGLGIFADLLGNDFYSASGVCLGRSGEPVVGNARERALSLGVFMDLGGQDSYPVSATYARNAERISNWLNRRTPAQESQTGVFYDR